MAFYLKYRPQKIDDLDLEDVRGKLEVLLSSGKVPHALLFSGPRGSGKTSSARIIAKAINCLKEKRKNGKNTIEPCNKCRMCQAITKGTSLDLIEIDAASNRGIDDIRNLQEKINLSPSEAKYKVYIIDEVHMLTLQAFNALLKTLEEPPAHAVFILCTTNPQALPETVTSRCLIFNFKKASVEEISRSLKRIIVGEKLKVEEGVLEKISQLSDGSFRDATKLLEQLSFSGKKIKLCELVSQTDRPEELLKILTKRETKLAISWIEMAAKRGIDWSIFLKDFLELLHKLLLANFDIGEKPIEVDLKTEELKSLIRLLERTGWELKNAQINQLPIELALLSWLEEKGELEEKPRPREKEEKVQVADYWEAFLSELKKFNHSAEALLRASRPKKLTNKDLTIEVFYKFHKEKLENKNYKELVEKALEKTLRRPLKVCYTLRK